MSNRLVLLGAGLSVFLIDVFAASLYLAMQADWSWVTTDLIFWVAGGVVFGLIHIFAFVCLCIGLFGDDSNQRRGK